MSPGNVQKHQTRFLMHPVSVSVSFQFLKHVRFVFEEVYKTSKIIATYLMLSWEAAFALTSWLTPSSDAECTQSSKKTPSRLSRSGCRALSAVNFRKKLQSSCEVISTSMKQVPCCVSCRSHVQATPSSFQD